MVIFRKFTLASAFAGVIVLTGCTNPMMPVAGPESWDIRGHVQDAEQPSLRSREADAASDRRAVDKCAGALANFHGPAPG